MGSLVDRLVEVERQISDKEREVRQHLTERKRPPRQAEAQPRDLGNFAHKWAEELLPARTLPRKLDDEVEIELTDGPTARRKRLDRVDRTRGIIYEIKPNTPEEVSKGRQQAKSYAEIMDREQPFTDSRGRKRKWRAVVVTYNKRDLARVALSVGEISLEEFKGLPDSWRESTPIESTPERRGVARRLGAWPRTRVRASKEAVERSKRAAASSARGARRRAGGKTGRGSNLPSIVFDVSGASEIVHSLISGLTDFLVGTSPDPIQAAIETSYAQVEHVWQEEIDRHHEEVLYRAQAGHVFAEVHLEIGTMIDPATGSVALAYLAPRLKSFWAKDLGGTCWRSQRRLSRRGIKYLRSLGLMKVNLEWVPAHLLQVVTCSAYLPVDVGRIGSLLDSVNLSGIWMEFVDVDGFVPPTGEEALTKLLSIFRIRHSRGRIDLSGQRVLAAGGNSIRYGAKFAITNLSWDRNTRKLRFEFDQDSRVRGRVLVNLIGRHTFVGHAYHQYARPDYSDVFPVLMQRERNRRSAQ